MPSFTSIDLIFGCGMEAGRTEAVAASAAFVATPDCTPASTDFAASSNSCAAPKPFTPASTPPGVPSARRVSRRCSENVPAPA